MNRRNLMKGTAAAAAASVVGEATAAETSDPLERLEQIGEELSDILTRFANGNYAAVVTPSNRGGGLVLQNMSLWERWERQSKEKAEAAKADAVLFDLEKQFNEAEASYRESIKQHSAVEKVYFEARRKSALTAEMEDEYDRSDAEMTRWMGYSHERLEILMEAPAHTLEGLRAKIRATERVFDGSMIEEHCWNSIAADIQRGIVV